MRIVDFIEGNIHIQKWLKEALEAAGQLFNLLPMALRDYISIL